MSHKAKWEYFKAIYERYRKAARRRGCKSRGEATMQDSRYGAPIIRERFIKKFGGIATIKELADDLLLYPPDTDFLDHCARKGFKLRLEEKRAERNDDGE